MKSFLRYVSLAVAAVALVIIMAACGDAGSGGGGSACVGTDGALLYQQGCSSCHGVDLQGTDTGPRFFISFTFQATTPTKRLSSLH